VAPLPRRSADAIRHLADDALHWGSLHYGEWMDTYEAVRAATARLIHCSPKEIALVKNTSEGIATVAMGLDWRPGDRVVGFREEFPANLYPWKRLEAKGVEVIWLSLDDPLERIEEASKGAKLLSISFVNFLSGYRAPLQEIGEICRRNHCIFFVDAIQGMGAFPLDVHACHIDALAADGHKWLLGPEGCGVLYISQELQERVEPVEFGWTNVASYADYGSRDMALREDAGRYECGTLNTVGCYGLRSSLELLLEIGVEEIAPVVESLGNCVARGVQAKGYEVMGRREAGSTSGIVSFRKPGTEAQAIVLTLKEHGVVAAPRVGWVRTAPHFYITPDDIERFLDLLP
jgi:selenocysteine lyase/cysteine desulfurase